MPKNKLSVIERIKKWCKKCGYDIDQMLEVITVAEVDEEHAKLNNIQGLIGWFYVADTDGVNSYYSTEKEACRARLDIINRVLND